MTIGNQRKAFFFLEATSRVTSVAPEEASPILGPLLLSCSRSVSSDRVSGPWSSSSRLEMPETKQLRVDIASVGKQDISVNRRLCDLRRASSAETSETPFTLVRVVRRSEG